MDNQPPDPPLLTDNRHRNYFSREHFDDYWIALMARIRLNEDADNLISGQVSHPLYKFQIENSNSLIALNVRNVSLNDLVIDPVGMYREYMRVLGNSLSSHPAPVPDLQGMQALDGLFAVHKRAQRFIYGTIVATLQVGVSMHYARQVRYGSGLHLLNIIFNDNRLVTTRSLMALFSALMSLRMASSETFELISSFKDSRTGAPLLFSRISFFFSAACVLYQMSPSALYDTSSSLNRAFRTARASQCSAM